MSAARKGGAPGEGDPRRCTAHRTNGEPCRSWAIKGGTVCRAHGGAAPTVRAAATRRLETERQQQRARRVLERRLGGRLPVADPLDVLAELVAEGRANLEVLGDLLAELEVAPTRLDLEEYRQALAAWRAGDSLAGSAPPPPPALVGINHLGDGAPNVLWAMYRDAFNDLARVAKAAADAGVAERGATLREVEGAMLAAFIDTLLRDPRLGLSPVQRNAGRAVAAEGLLRLEAEVAA